MTTEKNRKKVKKKRKPKGKKLSEALVAKEAKRAAEAEAEAEAAAAAAEEDDDDDLASEPPPAYDEEDDEESDSEDVDDDDGGDDGEGDDASARTDDDDDDEPPPSSAEYVDGDEEDDDDYEYVDDDEDLAAAQMGHQRYVMAGFFALWLVVGYIAGQALALVWSRFAVKDWFVESLPQLAAVPYEGDLWSRATISMVVGALIGAAIVLRYYTKPDVRQWADEVAEQLTHVKWPTRKDIGNNTVVVMVCSLIITLYLTLLDRFWGFVTNLIYTSGT